MNRILTLAAVLGLAGLAGPAAAADPTGTWKSTITVGNQALDGMIKLRLDSEGPRLTGAFVCGSASEAAPLASTHYKNGQISFTIHCEIDRQQVTIKCAGMQRGDTITGQCQIDQNGQVRSGDWIAKREK